MKKFCLLLCFYFSCGAIFLAPANEEKGSLIVTYKTDNKGERLDRIRFWLKEESSQTQSLYPKGKAFVEDAQGPSRMVVIEGLAPGKYTLRFLVPNKDRYFQEVPRRDVLISSNEIMKIDQKIKLMEKKEAEPAKEVIFEPIQNEKEPENEAEKEPEKELEKEPLNESKEINAEPFGELKVYTNIESANGKIVNTENQKSYPLEITGKETVIDLPEGNYKIIFEDNLNERSVPFPIEIKINISERKEINAYFPMKKNVNNKEIP